MRGGVKKRIKISTNGIHKRYGIFAKVTHYIKWQKGVLWDIFLYFPFLRVLTIVLSGCDLSRTTGIIIVLKYKKTNNGLIAIAIGIANISCYHDSTTIIKITQHRRFATRSGLNTRQHSSNNLRITLKTIKLVISSSHLAQQIEQ